MTLSTTLSMNLRASLFALFLKDAGRDTQRHRQHGTQRQQAGIGQGGRAQRAAVAGKALGDHEPEMGKLLKAGKLREAGRRRPFLLDKIPDCAEGSLEFAQPFVCHDANQR